MNIVQKGLCALAMIFCVCGIDVMAAPRILVLHDAAGTDLTGLQRQVNELVAGVGVSRDIANRAANGVPSINFAVYNGGALTGDVLMRYDYIAVPAVSTGGMATYPWVRDVLDLLRNWNIEFVNRTGELALYRILRSDAEGALAAGEARRAAGGTNNKMADM